MSGAVRQTALAMALGCALLGAGCGGDDEPQSVTTSPPPPAAAPENPLPGDQTPLEGGTTYTTVNFQPALRVTPPESGAWSTEVGDTPQSFSIFADVDVGQAILGAHRITQVFDPEKGGVLPGDMVPLTGGFAAWLAAHPRLKASKPEPVEVGGRSGVQIEFTTLTSPPKVPDICGHWGDNCVPLFWDGLDVIAYGDETRGRFIVLPLDDGGELVLEEFATPADRYEDALEVLQPLLDSIELA